VPGIKVVHVPTFRTSIFQLKLVPPGHSKHSQVQQQSSKSPKFVSITEVCVVPHSFVEILRVLSPPQLKSSLSIK
jgi:hypothetical protein